MNSPEVDLEAEYNNRARVPDHGIHIAGWSRDAAAYREAARCELDLAYGPGDRQRIDLFHAAGDAKGPVILFLHGGYWQALDKSFASHLARGANLRGLTVAVPSYNLAPAANLSDIIDCVSRAADFVAARMQRPLVVAGHSAGGHLAACLMGRSNEISQPILAAMPISGLFDLAPLVSTSVNRALGLTREEAQRLSPSRWDPPSEGKLVAVVGGAESAEYHRQSQEIVRGWDTLGGRIEFIPDAHHFEVIAGLADPHDRLVEILMELARED